MRAGLLGRVLLFLLPVLFTVSPAFAATKGAVAVGGSEALFVLQLVALMVVGRGLGELMERFGQPAVLGQLLAGIVLGPSIFGALWPAAQHAIFPASPEQRGMLTAVSELGILMLLLLTGMETDLAFVRRAGRAAGAIALAGVTVPFACGFALGEILPASLLPDPGARLRTALFLGTALAISSVKIVATVVREMNFLRRNLGQIIVASAILEDTIGWLIIAVIFSLGTGGGIETGRVAVSLAGTALFLILSFFIGRRLVFTIIRTVNDNFRSEFAVITAILVIMGIMALITDSIGVHTVLGAFVAGVLVGDSPILTQHIKDQLRGLIAALFMPVFFGSAGLSADLTVLTNPAILWVGAVLILIASTGKFIGAFVGSSIGGMSRKEALAIGCAMNARGSTEVIIASIGLAAGVFNNNLFTLVVTMAIVTTMAMPPTLRWALQHIPIERDERNRIAREEIDARSFIGTVERLLVSADESASGRFASHVAGVIAGARDIPATLLQWQSEPADGGERADGDTQLWDIENAFATGAAATAAGGDTGIDTAERRSDVVTKLLRLSQQVVADEAAKGYDLLVIGTRESRSPDGGFSSNVSQLAAGFEGPVAIALAHRRDRIPPSDGLTILLPVNGTEPSRRGAELAFMLAAINNGRVIALYLSAGADSVARPPSDIPSAARRQERAVLKEAAELADRYGATLRTSIRADERLDTAILDEARSRRCDLIIMGVSKRPDHGLYLGNTAHAVLNAWERALLFVAS